MKKKDERVTVKHTQVKFFCILFLIVFSICGSYAAIFYTIPRDGVKNGVYMTLALVTFVAVASGALVGLTALLYKNTVLKPVKILSEAAKKVADGDFSVKIPPRRKDGKKDEFELLFDDFNIMVSELASTEILKKDFVSNVSHELKTPLAAIQNLSAILQSDGLDEAERKEYAAKINEATKKLTSLVMNILQLSRLENQKIAVDKKDYNLSEQLCRCIVGFEQIWEAKNIEINTDFSEKTVICSDEGLTEIVWNNLLSNALKFTPDGGTVNISAKEDNNRITVTVEDNGCGMNEHDIKHIFDKFYQADASRSTQGNGLGLAFVKEIMNLIKGEISVESVPQKGSKFIVTVPKS